MTVASTEDLITDIIAVIDAEFGGLPLYTKGDK